MYVSEWLSKADIVYLVIFEKKYLCFIYKVFLFVFDSFSRRGREPRKRRGRSCSLALVPPHMGSPYLFTNFSLRTTRDDLNKNPD